MLDYAKVHTTWGAVCQPAVPFFDFVCLLIDSLILRVAASDLLDRAVVDAATPQGRRRAICRRVPSQRVWERVTGV